MEQSAFRLRAQESTGPFHTPPAGDNTAVAPRAWWSSWHRNSWNASRGMGPLPFQRPVVLGGSRPSNFMEACWRARRPCGTVIHGTLQMHARRPARWHAGWPGKRNCSGPQDLGRHRWRLFRRAPSGWFPLPHPVFWGLGPRFDRNSWNEGLEMAFREGWQGVGWGPGRQDKP